MSGGGQDESDARRSRAHAAFAGAGFNRLVGARLTAHGVGFAELRLDVTEHHRQQYGFVHGGLLAYLADNSLTFAGGSRLDGLPVTLEMKLNYIRPAIGETLIARAAALSAGRTQAVARCEIFCVDGGTELLCAAGQGTIALASEPRRTTDDVAAAPAGLGPASAPGAAKERK